MSYEQKKMHPILNYLIINELGQTYLFPIYESRARYASCTCVRAYTTEIDTSNTNLLRIILNKHTQIMYRKKALFVEEKQPFVDEIRGNVE